MAEEGGGGRGFSLSHQRVVLEVDFAGALTGSAHLTINPTNPALRTVYLHASPLLHINSVTLSSPTKHDPLLPTPATFAHTNPFQPLPVREPPMDLKSHQEIKRKTWAALGEKDEGELAISVSHGWVRLVETEGAGPDGGVAVSLAPIQIQIDYQLNVGGDVIEGIVFRRPGDCGDDSQIPHMYLSPTTPDAARIWTPCVDSLWERCTWELEFIVPRYLEGGEPLGDNDAFPNTVVASGELMEQVTHPHDPHKIIFYYIQTTPATVQHITFAAGPFEMLQVPTLTGSETQKPMLAFCLPGQMSELSNSTSFLSRAMTFYTTEFGSFPFSAFKMVFVANPRIPSNTAVTMSILSSDLLYPANVIDRAIETRQELSLALVQQWVGVNIIQRTLADSWLIAGLALYLHSQFIRHLFGNNEYRFRLKKDIDRCVRLDQGAQQPLCMPGTIDPPSASAMDFMSIKAPLVLHILDRHIAKSGTSLGLSRVIPRIFLASLSDELPGNMLSTAYFFRLCRKVSGMDLLQFQDQWVYGSGCPTIAIRTNFIRKKFLVEFSVSQILPAVVAAERLDPKASATALALKRPTPFFEGSLTVRIHEADGAPFEHLVDVKKLEYSRNTKDKDWKTYPLPFNTKYKRTRRSGHVAARFSKLQDVLEEAEDNDPDQAEELRDVDRGEIFAYPPWEDEEERRRWRVGDWSEEEAEAMLGEGGGYEWIRVDPDCEWIAKFEIHEKPWFWISQLQGDRDVVAQLQAIQGMTLYPSPVIASELARTVLVENYYYRVRMEAARALVAYNTSEADYIGLFLLLKLFHTLYCHPTGEDDPLVAEAYPLPNDFSNFADYFLKKSVITALSELRDPATRMVWRNVRQLLLNMLKHNDNSVNEYSDSYYVATVISAIGSAFAAGANLGGGTEPADEQLFREATDANERAITVDRLVPSYHNVVTQAGLLAQLKSIMVGQRTNDPKIFLSYTREGNYEPLRLMAFDCLLLCKAPGRSVAIAQYLFDVIRHDYSLTVRRHVARAFSESILMTLAVGEVFMARAPGVIEMDSTNPDREKGQDNDEKKIVKALRKDFNGKVELREVVQSCLLDYFTGPDHQVLFALIKAAEVMTSAVSEPKPGALIKLQTPVVETPGGSGQKIRLSLTGSADIRPPQADYGFPQTPETPSTNTNAIKLVLNNAAAAPKEKKKKNVPKAQSKGLSDQDFKTVTLVLQKLLADKRSVSFRQPVDPVRDGAPDYLTIVTHPMDLSTIRAKFETGAYTSRQDFEQDIRLMISNCYLYNPHGSAVRKAGEVFEKYFNATWAKTENTLRSSLAAPAKSAEPSRVPSPVPPPVVAPPRIKLKPTKSVTIDDMPPPPVPTKKAVVKEQRTPKADRPDKPKKKKPISELDDLLGEEIDAIESNTKDDFDDLLGPKSPPPVKKIKLTKPPAPTFPQVATARVEERPASKTKEQGLKVKIPSSPTKPASVKVVEKPSLARKKSDKPVKSRSPEKVQAEKLPSRPASGGVPSRSVSPVKPVPSFQPPPPADAPGPGMFGYVPQWPQPPADLPDTRTNSMPFRQKRAKALIQILIKDPQAIYFLRPVDPIRDGCPTYFDEIKHPSDYQTIAKKTDSKRYKTMGELARDIELIFANCRQFNPPGPITDMAAANEALYWKEWGKAVNPRMNAEERKAMMSLLNKALKEPSAFIFYYAVDPVALGIPTYFDIIPQEEARDLSLIKGKLEKGSYSTARQVDEDVSLMLENARVFNGPGEISDIADNFAEWWQSQRSKMDM